MTDPSHAHRPAHTMDARHPRALFPATVSTDSRLTPFRATCASTPWPSKRRERDPSWCAAPPIWVRLPATGLTAW